MRVGWRSEWTHAYEMCPVCLRQKMQIGRFGQSVLSPARSENAQKKEDGLESILLDNLFPVTCLPVRPSRRHRGACGVKPLSMGNYIAAMAAMRVDAHHAERQVLQPGLVPLPRTASEYHENRDIAIPFPPLVPSLDKPIVAIYNRQCRK